MFKPSDWASQAGSLNQRIIKRLGFILTAFLVSGGILLLLLPYQPWASLPDPGQHTLEPTCVRDNQTAARFHELTTKYDHLMVDKFTIAILTYKRPKELKATLSILTEKSEIPSLHEVVVIWNDLEEAPPADYTSELGVPIRFRQSEHNSLNQKLIPDPKYKTQAILLSDDDVYYEPGDLEWVFQSWRKFGQHRLVGALPRCSDKKKGRWDYNFCSNQKGENHYSMVLTNLCFSHIAYLDQYSSDDPISVKIREYIDKHFNCEDIALNYVASKLSGLGPLEANGFKTWYNMKPSRGISRKSGHMEARSQCLNDFEDIFGCMPLVDEGTHLVRGLQTFA